MDKNKTKLLSIRVDTMMSKFFRLPFMGEKKR